MPRPRGMPRAPRRTRESGFALLVAIGTIALLGMLAGASYFAVGRLAQLSKIAVTGAAVSVDSESILEGTFALLNPLWLDSLERGKTAVLREEISADGRLLLNRITRLNATHFLLVSEVINDHTRDEVQGRTLRFVVRQSIPADSTTGDLAKEIIAVAASRSWARVF